MPDVWRQDFADTPPFHHLRHQGSQIGSRRWPGLEELNALARAQHLVNGQGLAIRFETQTQRCGQRDYEAGILATGCVPTRQENWHDLLNALTWLALPQTKATLNAIQCQSLSTESPQRGPISDAATLFDESGLVLLGPDPSLAEDLRLRRWRQAFVARRSAWAEVTAVIVGHAVLEKLLAPWPGITAKCLWLTMPGDSSMTDLDTALAKHWAAGGISRPADLFPMPVLGIPGWWPANEAASFYEDETVFRPLRTGQ